ncbi:MAG: PilZ domain-containing protein [Deltaproteobacteria bacterium]
MEKLDLNKIISAGALIRTKFDKTEWISNVIYKIFNDIIQIELTQDYINKLIMQGNQVKCKVTTSETEYVIDGIVENIEIDDSRIISIKVLNINRFENARQNNRYDAYIISKITVNRETAIFSIVTSLSNSGISVLSKSELELNSDAFVELFIDSGNTIRFYGNIIRKLLTENGYEYGIKFKQLDQENQDMLVNVISEFKSKEEGLLKKFLGQ